jgi:ankyrin repeat protein
MQNGNLGDQQMLQPGFGNIHGLHPGMNASPILGIPPAEELHSLVAHNELDSVILLINEGVDVNERDVIGRTPLWIATAEG